MTMPNQDLVDKFRKVFEEAKSADEAMDALVQTAAEIVLAAPDDQCGMWLLAIFYGGARAIQTIVNVSDERLERAVSLVCKEARHDVLSQMNKAGLLDRRI